MRKRIIILTYDFSLVTFPVKCGMKLLIHSQTQRLHLCDLGMDKWLDPTLCNWFDYLSILGLNSYHVIKMCPLLLAINVDCGCDEWQHSLFRVLQIPSRELIQTLVCLNVYWTSFNMIDHPLSISKRCFPRSNSGDNCMIFLPHLLVGIDADATGCLHHWWLRCTLADIASWHSSSGCNAVSIAHCNFIALHFKCNVIASRFSTVSHIHIATSVQWYS